MPRTSRASRLIGKRVLITGATGGIGTEIARAFAGEGAKLVLSGRRGERLATLGRELGAETITADLCDRESVRDISDRAGMIDVLISNAALPASGSLDSFTDVEIERALDVNLRAPIMLARSLSDGMAERGSGHIVFISSLLGKVPSAQTTLYNATKFGLRGFALSLRQELIERGVGVSSVCPGLVREAGMFADTKVELPWYVQTSTPREVASAVLKAIERNIAEVDVAHVTERLIAVVARRAPSVLVAAQRQFGIDQLLADVVARQVAKR